MAVSTQCEYLTGPVNDDDTECMAPGDFFVNAAPELPTLRGVTYCAYHAVVVTVEDPIFWMDLSENEWMPLSEALAAA